MNQNDRENQSDPELVIDLTAFSDGWQVKVRRGGNVRYVADGFKSRDAAWEAGRVFVKNWLRGYLQKASGVSVRGERPAFGLAHGCTHLEPGCCSDRKVCIHGVACTHGSVCFRCWEQHCPENRDPVLEGEQLCSCGHSDGVHLLGANTCAFEPCKCEEFTAALAVEAVQ